MADEKQWNVISLGAGVQSSVMAMMASRGELLGIKVDFAIFADTQAEPKSVYNWLDWLEKQLSFPVHRVTAGSLAEKSTSMKKTKDGRVVCNLNIPFYTLNQDGSKGIIPYRGCTSDFKIKPILKELRSRCEIKRGQKHPTVTSLIGISLDEMRRMKPSREHWAVHRWPLVELRMKRSHCIEWARKNGMPEPPRSSCTFCPFHSDKEWRRLKTEEPDEFARAVQFEREVQKAAGLSQNFSSIPFCHPSAKPLDQIDFRSDVERGQMTLWDDECEGMCGV